MHNLNLHSWDRGCTRPGCTAPGYWCQTHHVDGWDADDGPTDIDKLTLACGTDNRMVEQGGWITRKRKDGRIEWIPPPHRDWGHLPLAGDGQARVNKYHHPEEFLVPEGRRSVARANPLYRIFIERLGEAYRASEGS